MYLSFRYVFVIVFFVILGPENVCLDTKIVFLCELETKLLKHVNSGGYCKKWPPSRSNVIIVFLMRLKHVYSGGHFYNMAAIKVKGQI